MLKKEILEKARKSDELILSLCNANNNRFQSVANWFKAEQSEKLMLHKNLTIIANHFNLTIDEIVEPELINS